MKVFSKIFLLSTGLFLVSCGGSEEGNSEGEVVAEESMYGGCFSMPIGSYFNTKPITEVQKLETAQVYDQVYESLVKYDPKTLEVGPSIASEWSVSDDGLTYSFTIREDVYFHDNDCFKGGKGRLLTPNDVLFSFKTIYENDPSNRSYVVFKNTIVGGEDYYNEKTEEISGISIEGNVVNIQIMEPSDVFIQKLATVFASIIPEESLDYTGNFYPVGTGPFVYDMKGSTSEKVQLFKNPNYYGKDADGNQLPFLDTIMFLYYEHSEDQMDQFWEGGLSYIPGVPISKISEVMEEKVGDFESKPPKYMLISEPQLSTTYLEFNMETPVLKKKKVRQAINYAINRKKLKEKVMKNQAYEIGKFGITPPLPKVFKDYDFEGIEDVSYTYNPEKAKQLLAEAGYPDGKGFPSLEMQFRIGNEYYLVASEIQSQLRSVLNINIDIEAMDLDDLIENQGYGRADIFRATWFGDYPNPETFLVNAYGKAIPKDKSLPSYINSSRFKNAQFDKFFDEGAASGTSEEAYAAYAEAEKILMEEAPFIILWYGEDMMLLDAAVRQLETNGMRYLDLREVYFKTPTKEEYEEKES
ncbi:MAG: ABC transporter substrate-binding protein [Flavobacteriales bacterium]|nr:ABC transporter substrate-binding protein [Flavobacteriales bacterium]